MSEARQQRIEMMHKNRRADLTVIFENIHDPHNISACLRSCDAVGVSEVYVITTDGRKQSKLGKKSSASAAKWLAIHHFGDVRECFEAVRQRYQCIYCTHLAHDAVSLYQLDFSKRIALVFGNEHEGVSATALALSDGNYIIPQVGMIRSLNISVACAVSLYEAFRQKLEIEDSGRNVNR